MDSRVFVCVCMLCGSSVSLLHLKWVNIHFKGKWMHGCGNKIFVCLQQRWESNPVTWANLVLWYFVISLYSWESWKMRHMQTQTHTLVYTAQSPLLSYFQSHYWVRGGEAERKRKQIRWHPISAAGTKTQYCLPHLCFLKMNIFCRYFYSHTTINPPDTRLELSNGMWHVSVVNHSCAASCEWLRPFSKWVGLELVVRGGKLTAWFPHVTGEEDYASNPPNSICSNEYVCVFEEGNASVYDKKGKKYVCVQFQSALETLSRCHNRQCIGTLH